MSQIKIIRASAGSGKTYFLTGAFLKLLMSEETGYFKTILAVTFTNKATEEMKARIIDELNALAHDGPSGYLNDLIEYTGFKEDHIRNKSAAILQQILHGYSWFSIETIDTFFQKVLKAFARELGIPGNYSIEIETEPALTFAIDNLLDEIQEGSSILEWLMQFTDARIDEGRVWDIKNELFTLSHEIFRESFALAANEVYNILIDKEKLSHFRRHLSGIITDTEKVISDIGLSAMKILHDNGFEANDFYQGNKGVYGYFAKVSEKQINGPNSYVVKMLEGAENWPSSKTTKKNEIINIVANKLLPALTEILKYIEVNSSRYFTAKEISKNLYSLGILSDIAHRTRIYYRDNNSFLLSDAPVFINKIIDHNEAPFIYEKVGNRYNHFMIDEFQDTSALQWRNFKPLIDNSLSMGKECLIVGDIKQSIYRWRNSDWEIIARQVFKEFYSSQINSSTLETNWRSRKEIVNFNNLFFPVASKILNKAFLKNAEISADDEPGKLQNIDELYAGSVQLVADKSIENGRVLIRFIEKDLTGDIPGYYEPLLLSDIKDLLENGYQPGDIAILVRQKNEGQKIADLLIKESSKGYFSQPLQVISNESLFLNTSHEVNLLVAALQYIADPTNQVNCEKLLLCYNLINQNSNLSDNKINIVFDTAHPCKKELTEVLPGEFINNIQSLLSLPLYELTERLINIFQLGLTNLSGSELPYIHGFLDLVFDYGQNNPSDISKFMEYWDKDGKKKSISASDNQNAVQILTIHKSKGLEFKAVIVPFCNWGLNQKSSTILWAKAASDDLSFLPCYPVNYTKSLLKTEFSSYYIEEMLKSYVDNLNLLYVATTRSVETLIAYPVYKENKKDDLSIATVGDLLYQTITGEGSSGFIKYFNPGENKYEVGEIIPKTKESPDEISHPVITSNISGNAIDRLYCRYFSIDYFTSLVSEDISPAKHGSVLHGILSEVRTKSELETNFHKAVFEGLINKEEASELLQYINSCMENQLISSWFNPDAKIMNEADILLPDCQTRRPDRVVIFPDSVDIIDYKFGSQKAADEYLMQMKEYKNLCLQMGYQNVKGYLWYITLNQIVEV